MENQNDSILSEVVFWQDCEWKKVPGFANAYVSEEGKVAVVGANLKLRLPHVYKYKTTKGSYLYSAIMDEEGARVTKAHHQLICLTFKGPPPDDGKKYEPNHMNGDKHDNRPQNLEWMTRSQNVQHAFDSGMCIVGLRITVLNVLTNEKLEFNSLSAAARQWGLSRGKLRDVMANHRSVPYLGQWVFVIDDSSDKKLNRYQRTNIVYKNYATGEVVICEDSGKAAFLTGIKVGTILARTATKGNTYKNKYAMIGGYVFKTTVDPTAWPVFSDEEIALSVKTVALNSTANRKICLVKDYLTEQIFKFISIKDFMKWLLENGRTRVYSDIVKRRMNTQKLYKGCVVKDLLNEEPWPNFSPEEIHNSIF